MFYSINNKLINLSLVTQINKFCDGDKCRLSFEFLNKSVRVNESARKVTYYKQELIEDLSKWEAKNHMDKILSLNVKSQS